MRIDELDTARDYDRIYLAPHPDDAALSYGGTIACRHKQGERQLVVTLCSAIPPSAESLWHQRLDEDERALRVLGVDYLLGGFLDAPFRHPAYGKDEGLFAPPVVDDSMQRHVGQLLVALAEQNRQATLYSPLGVGSHVDHLIAFEAAQAARHFAEVHHYEDFPYTVKDPGALKLRLDELGNTLTAVVTDIRHGIQKKAEAVGQYSSQVHFLFGSFDAAFQALVEEARRVLPGGVGERCWILMYR